tara:strand:- start:380 stop:1381 length:1002 start_codon:yes stop_codon:yes gene_type:complete
MNIISENEANEQAQNDKIIQTCCNGCVFAKPQPDDNTNLDDYCSAGRLSKFKEVGASLLSIRLESEDNDGGEALNYKAVNERACNLLRSVRWKAIMEHRGVEDLLAQAKKEIELSCTLIIYIDETKAITDKDQIEKIVSSVIDTYRTIELSDIQPKNVSIINPCIMPTEFVNLFRKKIVEMYNDPDMPEEIRTPWNMEYIPYQDAEEIAKLETAGEEKSLPPEQFRLSFIKRHIDLSAKESKAGYWSFFFAGNSVPKNYLSDINNYINVDLNRLIALRGDDDISPGMLVQNLIHKQLSGNKGGYILDKIDQLTKDQECPEILKKISEVVKNFE